MRRQVLDEDPNHQVDDENLQTLQTTRRSIATPTLDFESIHDEISASNMDKATRKGNSSIHAVNNSDTEETLPAETGVSPSANSITWSLKPHAFVVPHPRLGPAQVRAQTVEDQRR